MTEVTASDAMAVAVEARGMMLAHEKLCAERQANILSDLKDIKDSQVANALAQRADVKGINNQLWIAMGSVVALMSTVILALVFHTGP